MMSRQKSNLRQLAAFFLLAFVIGWPALIPLLLNPRGPSWSAFIYLFSPAISACIVAGAANGRAGVRSIFGRYLLWRFPVRWYLLALLFVPAVFLVAILIFSAGFARSLWTNSPLYFVAASFLYLMFITSGEEIGWRGFALPRVQAAIPNPWLASIALGLIWGAWHLPEYFAPGITNIPLLPFLVMIASLSTVYTVLFNHTQGSLFLAVLLHASTDIVPRIIKIGSLPPDFWWLIAGLILVAGIVLHLAAGNSKCRLASVESSHDEGAENAVRYNYDS